MIKCTYRSFNCYGTFGFASPESEYDVNRNSEKLSWIRRSEYLRVCDSTCSKVNAPL